MAVSLKHTTQTAEPDSADGKISADAWNEEHALTLATDKLLGRVSASTGAVEEVTCTDFIQTLLDDADAEAARDTLDVRELLTANRDYYVRTDGSDANDGLANTAGGAFLTILHAVDVVREVDAGIYTITINVAAGTFNESVSLRAVPTVSFRSAAQYVLSGAGASSTTIDGGGTSAIFVLAHGWQIKGFKLQATTFGQCIDADFSSIYVSTGMEYGVCGNGTHLLAHNAAAIYLNNSYTVSGAATAHWFVASGSFLRCRGATVTVSGTPAFSNAFVVAQNGRGQVDNNTFSGAATGTRFKLEAGGLLEVGAGGASYFPGNAAGTIISGLYQSTAGFDTVAVTDEAYDATTWNGALTVPTKNAVRDKIESLGSGVSDGDKGDVAVSSSGAVWTVESIGGKTFTTADAGADALLGWDDSASAYQNLSAADARAAIDAAALSIENQVLTGGVTVTEKDLGTISSGTLTLDMGDRPIQKYINNGAHTLAPGAVVGSSLIVITNDSSAGAITTSGWTHIAGSPFTTTDNDAFVCSATINAAGSLLVVQKMQGAEGGGSGIGSVEEDTAPVLGGSLDGGGFDITNVDDATFDTLTVADDAYNAGTWDGSVLVPTKNAVRDKIEGLSSVYQPLDTDLTTWAGLTPSANAQSLVTAANYAAMRALLDLEGGTDFYSISAADAAFQPKDADLTSWAGVTRASGFDTFAATPSSANLDALLTDDTGSGACVFADTPTLIAPLLGTPTSGTLTNCTGLPAAGVVGTALVTGGALGTPSSGTLSGCTGLPVAGITSSTSTALGVGSLELGNASDTTLARFAAGHVTVEGIPCDTTRYSFVPTGTPFNLGNNANVQAYLPAANDTFTCVANTTYFFESMISLQTNNTTHTTAWGLLGAGSATIANVLWHGTAMSGTIATQAATATHVFAAVATAVILNATSAAIATQIWIKGQFRVSTAGTIIPSIQFSAGPGTPTGNNNALAGTYFRLMPMLSDTTSSAGAWA